MPEAVVEVLTLETRHYTTKDTSSPDNSSYFYLLVKTKSEEMHLHSLSISETRQYSIEETLSPHIQITHTLTKNLHKIVDVLNIKHKSKSQPR